MFNFKSYSRAGSIKEAIRLLGQNPEARLIAGGTDVLVKLHKGKGDFDHLIDIHDIAELNFIRQNDDGDLVIGPLSCFTHVAESPPIRKHIPVLSEAILTIGGPQVRNMATKCRQRHAAYRPQCRGNDRRPGRNAATAPGRLFFKTRPGEIMTAITVSRDNYAGYSGHFFKYAMRDAMDIATIGCSAVCKVEDEVLTDLRLAYGVAAPVPIRCKNTEDKIRGCKVSTQLLDDIAEAVADDVSPRTSWRATKDFRLQIIATLAHRVVRQAILNAGGTIH
jgi:xanthine dehydrogenase FAD-binding subunit